MQSDSPSSSSQRNARRGESCGEALSEYSEVIRSHMWAGTFCEFLRTVFPGNVRQLYRTSHEYLWDMLCWFGRNGTNGDNSAGPKELFKRELYGIDDPLGRIVDYFKAA